MHHTESSAGALIERTPIGEGCTQKRVGTDNVRPDGGRRIVDRSVDMRFRRQVKNAVRSVRLEYADHPVEIADVGMLEYV